MNAPTDSTIDIATNEIEQDAMTQVRNIADDPSILAHTRMTSRLMGARCKCGWLDCYADADYSCIFDTHAYLREQIYWLCTQHKTRCETLQSIVLTDNLINH